MIRRPRPSEGSSSCKLFGIFLLVVTLTWFVFAFSFDDEGDVEDGEDGTIRRRASPGAMFKVPQRILKARKSPAPEIKAKKRPPYRMYLGDEFNLRGCECRKDWQELPADSVGLCRCNEDCPSFVTPAFLTEAKGQGLCNLFVDPPTGYNCHAECLKDQGSGLPSQEVKWYAGPCGDGKIACDPRIKKPEEKQKQQKEEGAKALVPAPAPAPVAEAPKPEEVKKSSERERITRALGWDPYEHYDFRGLNCEEYYDGKPRCFYEDAQGRELCPEHVTPDWLAFPKDQYLCSPEMADKYYCTVGCQEGNPEVRWGANEVAWCDDPKNKGACVVRSTPIPKKGFKLAKWSEKVPPKTKCEEDHEKGIKPKGVIEGLTAGMLTHEPKSMADTLETYEKNGFFDVIGEFLVYANKRTEAIDQALKPYVEKYPGVVKVLGDSNNYGILRGINFLTGNASNPHFLFLERDFQLVEPATCVYEQLTTGINMVKNKKADVVRYRHKRKAGRPNWAERMYRGKEDAVFKSAQPNLFCNHHYWYPEPEKRWPDKIWICNDDPVTMWCSDSYYCNWTNNPQLWSVAWWDREYVKGSLAKPKVEPNPWNDLEFWMNWDFEAWNNRKFTVAQGEGLFKHVDRGNFGI